VLGGAKQFVRKRALKRSRNRKLVLPGETEVPELFFSLRLKDLLLPSRVVPQL